MKKRFWIGLAALIMCLTAVVFKGSEPVKTHAIMRAISATAVLVITYGVVDASKGTEGITAAEIVIK